MRFVVERRSGAFAITAMTGRASVGRIGVMIDDLSTLMRVRRIDVVPGSRRQGVATQLYERAARIACSEYGAPLASDFHREVGSEGFWQKQVAKGRATCLRQRIGGCDEYALRCPAPRSLAGRAPRTR